MIVIETDLLGFVGLVRTVRQIPRRGLTALGFYFLFARALVHCDK